MSFFAGIDTSNYTTSCAVVEAGPSGLKVISDRRRLLPVREGEKGIRQNEAVFHHTADLPALTEEAAAELRSIDPAAQFAAVGASDRPCSREGSYMPCFTVGMGAARTAAALCGIPCRFFTHQQGHIASVLTGAGRLDLLRGEFIAFHVSGGTTEAVICTPGGEDVFSVSLAASSLDLKAGQLIDRVGLMLGLPFPSGAHVDRLACASGASYRIRPSMRGGFVSISGAENKCREMFDRGEKKEDICLYCILYVEAAVAAMTEAVLSDHPGLPVVYSGGVMANSIIGKDLTSCFGGIFSPRKATDNAVGTAVLTALAEGALNV